MPYQQCQCFAKQCSDWPLRLIIHGILHPTIAFILLIIEVATCRRISVLIDENVAKFRLSNGIYKTRIFATIRTFIRSLMIYSFVKIFDFLKQESSIFQYQGQLGFAICYLELSMNFVNRIVVTYITFQCTAIFIEIFFNYIIYTSNVKSMITLRFSGAPLSVVFICISSLVFTMVSAVGYSCRICDQNLDIYQIERIEMDYKAAGEPIEKAVVAMDVLFLVATCFFHGFLCFLSLIAFVLMFSFGTAIKISLVAVTLHSFHMLLHFTDDLLARLNGSIKFDIHYSCFPDFHIFFNDHCAIDDLLFIFQQLATATALLSLYNFLKNPIK